MISINLPRFELGQVVATPAALELLERLGENVLEYVSKHVRGDWCDLSDDDAEANENALVDGSRILSSYVLKGDGDDQNKIWIITDAEDDDGKRKATTVMLPEEY
jgi:hypothetical protein